MAFPTMVSTATADTKSRTVAVTVEHDPAQSFSRSVKPRAFKEFKAWVSAHIMFGSPELLSVDYHDEDKSWKTTGRTLTTYNFSY